MGSAAWWAWVGMLGGRGMEAGVEARAEARDAQAAKRRSEPGRKPPQRSQPVGANNSEILTIKQRLQSFEGAMDADELRILLGMPRATIYKWVRGNTVPHFRVNGCLKFDPGKIAAWLDETTIEPYQPNAKKH